MCLCPVQARGSVEQWLGSVEAAMRMAVRGQARRAHRDYVTGPGRWDWVRVTPAQLVVVVSNIHWCRVRMAKAWLTGFHQLRAALSSWHVSSCSARTRCSHLCPMLHVVSVVCRYASSTPA